MFFVKKIAGLMSGLLLLGSAHAGKLAIVIDDFGYRPQQENQVLQMPQAVSVAVLPNAPHAHQMATKAHQRGHEVLIHLPMAPLSKQPLERDTLNPEMSLEEIRRIIHNAVQNVPYAVGLNNHMGSKMTSSLPGMRKVMQVLDHYNLYFLDSMTIGNSQASRAAIGTRVRVIKRRVFLDDSQQEAEIRRQFTRAVHLAQRNGSAIAIGHPHPTTIRVLQQILPTLPADITLVKPSQLLDDAQSSQLSDDAQHEQPPSPAEPAPPRNPFRGDARCMLTQPLTPVPAARAFEVISESVKQGYIAQLLNRLW